MENGTQLTLPGLDLTMFQKPNVTVSDFRVRLSALLETDEALKIHEGLYFLKSCGLLKSESLKYYSRKTSQGSSTIGGGVTFDVIISTMAELGYLVEWQVLNSRYLGVPQNRERVFLVGHLGDRCGREVFPIAADDTTVDKLQGHESIVSNTLAHGDRKSVGIYPIERERESRDTQSERISQVLITGIGKPNKIKSYTNTIIANYNCIGRYERPYIIQND